MDLAQSLKESDPVLFELIKEEETRQREHLELIASEVSLFLLICYMFIDLMVYCF